MEIYFRGTGKQIITIPNNLDEETLSKIKESIQLGDVSNYEQLMEEFSELKDVDVEVDEIVEIDSSHGYEINEELWKN